MALAYTKAGWNFDKYLYAHFNTRSTAQNWYYGLKSVLLNLGWTMRGGHTGVHGLHHNDGSNFDVMQTPTDFTKDGQDFYVIMRGPGGLGDMEICFGSNYGNSESWWNSIFFIVSYNSGGTGGFGSAYGGSDGSGSLAGMTPPTALDQHVVWSQNSSGNSRSAAGSSRTFSFYGAVSTDGLETRVIGNVGNVLNFFFSVSHLDNAHPNLENSGRVFTIRGTSDTATPMNSVMDNDYYTSAMYYGRVSGVNRSLYLGTSGYANLGHQSLNTVQQDNKMVVAPMDLYNNTLGEKGYYGTIPDQYWGNNNHFIQLLGDSVGGAPDWFSGGSIISPWDGVTPERLPRVF